LVIGNQYQLPIFFRIGNWYFRNSRKNGQIMSSLDYWKTWLHFEYQNLILHHKIAIHSNHKLFLSFFCPRIAHFRENNRGAGYAARACLVVFARKRTEWNCAGIAERILKSLLKEGVRKADRNPESAIEKISSQIVAMRSLVHLISSCTKHHYQFLPILL